MSYAVDHHDPRIPFPVPATPTACRRTPQAFDVDRGEVSDLTAADRIRQAKAACRACPAAAACMRWALAHPALTRTNVWAATTAPERAALRKRLVGRLGPDWIGVIARQSSEP
ncbi:WhiB family transcriptional regulator [Streptomyces sp. NPDC005574]|uniref:WhiB family transcriptional regulator n=1 Tax=Streptomyces sp. NPDC005574 TaxID=3156891 RepID=UPI0033B1B72D